MSHRKSCGRLFFLVFLNSLRVKGAYQASLTWEAGGAQLEVALSWLWATGLLQGTVASDFGLLGFPGSFFREHRSSTGLHNVHKLFVV